jgi:gamma-glutamylcyclotransferase (GGCT)/AIG2-like uncharacterized protein YtfP/cation transport regulator ChaC
LAVNHVFVYGTLLSGMDNFHLIEPYAEEITPGETFGKLFHLSYGYPALIAGGSAAVRGELVRLADVDAALPVLDHLEGYQGPVYPDNNYDRRECLVTTADGRQVPAYVYTWSHLAMLDDIGTPLAGGCWREFLAERPDDVPDRYYFAYGSCMDNRRIAASGYAADFAAIGPARLDGWSFRLNKRGADGCATANIEPAKGRAVHGILYRITGRAEREYLNRRDGYPQHYFKEYLDIVAAGQTYPSTVVHVARREHTAAGLPVTDVYAAALHRGADALPADYRAELLRELDRRHRKS